MNYWESHTQVAVRFRRFDRKRYAAFRSMHKVINIGVVTASMLLFALPDTAQAQKTIEPNRTGEEASVELEEVEVTASRAPIARNQATKIVTVIPAREIATAPVTSIQDLLEYAAGIDVRQRGEGGTQADISIRGGTFDQIAVLLKRGQPLQPTNWPLYFDLPGESLGHRAHRGGIRPFFPYIRGQRFRRSDQYHHENRKREQDLDRQLRWNA